jgi:hypothetical protein
MEFPAHPARKSGKINSAARIPAYYSATRRLRQLSAPAAGQHLERFLENAWYKLSAEQTGPSGIENTSEFGFVLPK